ncbi:MAG: methyltransferase domain-containing protein [bacterium]|jgi:Methyltransferase domain
MNAVVVEEAPKPPLKLDIGCGKNKAAGFHGVDSIQFDGVDTVMDVRETPWPWEDDSVDEVHSSHFVEHLTNNERVKFWNELGRVMKKGAQARIVVPHWSNACAYGDPTHQWPPMSEWAVYYLNKAWRDANAPHAPLTCDFDFVVGGSWEPWLETRTMETKMFAMGKYINSYRDLIITITKK